MKIEKQKIFKELAGKHHKDQKRNLTISLPETLISEFKDECERNGVKMNQVIHKLIETFLKEDNE